MVDEEKKKQLNEKLKELRDKASELRTQVNLANSKKEETLEKKREFSNQIAELIGKVKGSKIDRNKKTGNVKELKEKRREINQVVKDKVVILKDLQTKKSDYLSKSKSKESPAVIKKRIDELEFQIETEGMSFDKEQKVMKQIAELKKHLGNSKGTDDVFEDLKSITSEVNKLKKEANLFHNQIQDVASKSQEHHESLIVESSKIEDLKKQEKEFLEKFNEEKKDYKEKTLKLKEVLDEMNSIKKELNIHREENDKESREQVTKSLKEKTKEVEEKIKKGKKLTTQDFLIMQGQREK